MGRKKQSEAERLREAHPDEPWLWRKEWTGGVVRGSARLEASMLGLMAVAFVGLSIPATLAIPEEIEKGNHAILLVLIFTVVGLGLGWAALNRLRHLLRFGALSLRLDPFPGSWGGVVGGVLDIPKGARINGEVEVNLRCRSYATTGSGNSRSRRETVLWETDKRIPASALPGMGFIKEIPLRIGVPRGKGRPTHQEENQSGVKWTLEVKAPVQGRKQGLRTEFEIPVFDRGEDRSLEEEMTSDARQRREEERHRALADAGGRREMVLEREVWSFHQPTAKRQSWSLVLFGLIFAAVAWWVPVLFMQVIFGGFALLMFAILPGILWHRSELTLGDREIEFRRRNWRGWKSWRLQADEIARLELGESMRAGDTRYLRLKAIGVQGVDPEKPHAAEHFHARKARYRWKRESKGGADPSEETYRALLETPCFEIELAGYLQGTRAAEDVKSLLEEALGLTTDGH